MTTKTILRFLFLWMLTTTMYAQVSKEIIASLKFRNIGPGFMTGRISDIEKDPNDASTWYVAVSSGNVWKTINNGTTWNPIFENYGSFSTGCITIDPTDSQIIWLGTGENQSQRSASWGDGVYKSIDGGKSWKNMGLPNSQHIGKILIDPRDHNTVYVASQGPLWSNGGNRGLYKTTDGGETWNAILQISKYTGITDISFDPNNPDIIYAASYQRRRHVGILVAGGDESRIYKSSDAGKTWKKLSRGLPSGNLGRIAIAVSPQKNNVVYALISGATKDDGGFYRSENSGETWNMQSNYSVVDPQYYGELYASPHAFDHVYAVDVIIHHSKDGGKSFKRLNNRNRHTDNHEIVFDVNDPNYLMVGGDGGIYESWDTGATWKYHNNLPITQFYRVGIDNAKPFYNVYGGTQDNATVFAPSQTTTVHGITNKDWKITIGGDGFQSRVDPDDTNIVYSQYQYAGIVRYDKRTGQKTDIQPQPNHGDTALRWHWDSPLVLSAHHSKTLYYAAQRLFKSTDRGDSWQPISTDLSRGENRNKRAVMGKIWPPEAVYKNVFTSPYGTIVSLSESPLKKGLIVVGTDDGLIQITENEGESWNRIDHIKGIPQKAYVADVFASSHNSNTIYAVFNNHKEGDFSPYFVKSTDLGKTWKVITNGIKPIHAGWSLVEDHVSPNLLFAATEFGVYSSLNQGEEWQQMKNGLPTIAVRDLEIQKRENDLVVASFGRGMYILDDYTVLREATSINKTETKIFTIKKALQFFKRRDIGWSRKGSFGDAMYSANNPKYGAKIRFYLGKSYSNTKQQRLHNSNSSTYPTTEELTKEDFEKNTTIKLKITKGNKTFALLNVSNRKGYQEVNWNLSTKIFSENGKKSREIAFVPDGVYNAQLIVEHNGILENLGEQKSFTVETLSLSPEKSTANRFEFYSNAAELSIKADALNSSINDALKTIDIKKKQFIMANRGEKLKKMEENRLRLLKLQYALAGNETLKKHSEYQLPGVRDRISRVLGNQWESFQVTQTHKDNLILATKELNQLQITIKEIIAQL